MFIPRHFAEEDHAVLFDLMQSNNFVTLVTTSENIPMITHLPVIVDADKGSRGTLSGHFARANPHWKEIRSEDRATVIFHGPHCYVSPLWYEDISNVPTWNYAVVHATGPVKLTHDKEELLDIVSRLTRLHEEGHPDPWLPENAHKHLDKLLAAIVGFSIDIETIDGKFKLSQNRGAKDRYSLRTKLSRSDDAMSQEIATLMSRQTDDE